MNIDNMTDEEKLVKIAEAHGWGWNESCQNFKNYRTGQLAYIDDRPSHRQLPDYLNDLNVMNEAEKAMGFHSDSAWRGPAHEYREHLAKVCNYHTPHCASARQRADAFLLTL